MSGRTRWATAALTVACLGVLAGEARGQACLGVGAMGGQGYVVLRAAVEADAWAPGGRLGYNTAGAVSVAGTFDHTLIDDADLAFSAATGSVAVELPWDGPSICAVGLTGYQWVSDSNPRLDLEGAQDGFVFGVGMAIGDRFESGSGSFSIVPRAAASIIHNRAGLQDLGAPAQGGRTFGRFEGGLTLVRGRVFLGSAVLIDTLEGSDVVFIGALGVAF